MEIRNYSTDVAIIGGGGGRPCELPSKHRSCFMIENGQHMSVVATDGCASKTEAEISQVFKEMTPKRYRFLRDASGIDAANQRLEVAPASHYQCGGIYINERGESSVKGLYAGGEVAGNFQGASRLAGSALCDTQTMGARIGG